MAQHKYDIFISYRRDGGAQYARILQLMLQQRGYKVFLDYDELTDGIFGDHIKAAIKDAPVFMLVLSEKSMQRCVNEDDWVRQEILLAIQEGKHLVPVNPDNMYDGMPEDTAEKRIPTAIREQVSSHQYSEIGFGQTLGVTIDLMIKNRLVPSLGRRNVADHVDTDFTSAQETLEKIDAHNRFMKRVGIAGAVAVVLIVLATCVWFWQRQKEKDRVEAEKTALLDLQNALQEKYREFNLVLAPDLTMSQMNTIDTILYNMSAVKPGTLWMSQFEMTEGQWHALRNESYDETQKFMPVTNVSWGEVYNLILDLTNMTKIDFALPTAEEWEFAARSGEDNDSFLYAGDNEVDKVAWYKDNSGGKAHPSDGQQKDPNMLDLFDMSGNVGELTNSPYGDGLYTVCGGDFNSPASEVTVTSRKGVGTDTKDKTIGFRLVIRKE